MTRRRVRCVSTPAIPDGFEYWTVGESGRKGFEESWRTARALKERREELRPDLLVRVSVVWVPGAWVWWILRKEESRVKERAT